ncbi:hypothetical protein SDC9_188005 [bioreactor metagenome]|uniref:Uncharacterized protein n=1 Tax=bioreactor metagenome TaxID=1076179 RepID=A0A645HND6_9ZZZZ
MLDIVPPAELDVPIPATMVSAAITPPQTDLSPQITGSSATYTEWKEAGKVNLHSGMSTMHRIGEVISDISFCYDNDYVYFRIEMMEFTEENDIIELKFVSNADEIITMNCYRNCFAVETQTNVKMLFARKDTIDIAIEAKFFANKIKFLVKTISEGNTISYPINDYFQFEY